MNESPARNFASYPLRHTRIWQPRDIWAALLFAIPPAVAYFLTLQRGVGWWDSGELIAAAKSLGIAHRPGFPLYVLGGHVFYGWLEDPRWAANALSAIAGLAALVFLWRAFQIMAGPQKFSALWVGAGGWLVAWAPLFWRQTIRAEVYAPAYAVLALAFLIAVAAQHAPDPRTATRRFMAVAYLAGLAFCLHSALAVSVWPLLTALFVTGNFRPSWRQSIWAAFALGLGLSVYLYVPLRAPHAHYVWGDPSSLSGFWAYLTASDSFGVIAHEAAGTLTRIVDLLFVVWANADHLLLALGVAGVVLGALAVRAGGRLPWALAIPSLAVSATVVSQVIADNFDLQAYLFPLLWVAWWGWVQINPFEWLADTRVGSKARRLGTAGVIAALAFMSITVSADGTRNVQAAGVGMSDLWGQALLSSAMPGDLIVVQDANTDFLIRGIAASEPGHRGIVVLNTALSPAAWYRNWWTARYLAGEATEVDPTSRDWPRQVASWWREQRGQVYVDFGTPGWTAEELTASGWLTLWSESATLSPDVPVLDVSGADSDPDWIRTAVWFYYRLGTYCFDRGLYNQAAASWNEGLRWAPQESVLLERLAQSSQRLHAQNDGEVVP